MASAALVAAALVLLLFGSGVSVDAQTTTTCGVGPGTAFPGAEVTSFENATAALARTILLVEVADSGIPILPGGLPNGPRHVCLTAGGVMNAEFHDPGITGEIDATTAGWQHQEGQDENRRCTHGERSPQTGVSIALGRLAVVRAGGRPGRGQAGPRVVLPGWRYTAGRN